MGDRGTASHPIVGALRGSHPGQRLFARIERELSRKPPPEASLLVSMQQKGASREQMRRLVADQFPQDLALRVLANRWIDEVSGMAPEKPTAPAANGEGTPTTIVQPLAPKP